RGTLWLAISRTVPSMPPTSLLGDLSTGLEAFPGEPTRATLLAAFSASQNVYLCTQIESDGTVLFPIARVHRASDVSYFEMLPPGEQAALTMALILFCITAAITVVRLVAMAKYHGLMIFNMPRLILGLLLLSLVFQIVYYALVATHAIDRLSLGDMFFSTFPGYINFSIFIVLLGCWIEDLYLNYPTGLLLLIRHRLYWSDIFFYSLFLVDFIIFASIPDSWPDWTLTNCQEYSYSPRAIATIVFNSLVTSLSLPLGFLLLGYATFMFFKGRANAFPRGATPFLLLSFFYISAFIGQSIYLVYYSVSKEQLHLSPSVACTLIIALCPAILLLITLRHGNELAQPVVDPFADSRPLVRENMSDAHDTDDDDEDEDETVR
ncbi:MAG: hypothetical protein Q8P67_05570, partial [archaeon]|nr:hypothetical protein [archaeon]